MGEMPQNAYADQLFYSICRTNQNEQSKEISELSNSIVVHIV